MKDWLNKCHTGDVRAVLIDMIRDGVKVNTIVTSPPYWGLRSYLPEDHPDKKLEIGSEPTLALFLETMVGVFNLAREVLADDGTMWVNMGDSYNAGTSKPSGASKTADVGGWTARSGDAIGASRVNAIGLKTKDLVGQPWRLAFALQDAGWWLRQDIIWNKPNPMPESVRDRCTKSHEYLFLLAKQESYYWDFDAMQEPVNGGAHARRSIEHSGLKRPAFGHGYDEEPKPRYLTPSGWASGPDRKHDEVAGRYSAQRAEPDPNVGRRVTKFGALSGQDSDGAHRTKAGLNRKLAEPGEGIKNNGSMDEALEHVRDTRNRRSVWTVPTEAFREAHFATFPSKLIEPCILAGCPPGGTVLDIFMGSGTTAQVAQKLGRNFIGIDIDQRNESMQAGRTRQPSFIFEEAD